MPQGGAGLEIVIFQYDKMLLDNLSDEKSVIDSEEKLDYVLNEGDNREGNFYVSSQLKRLEALFGKAKKIFMPVEYYIDHITAAEYKSEFDRYLILDLKHTPSSAKMLEQLESAGKNRDGVFRLRRGANSPDIYKKSIGDIIVLSEIFGEPKNLFHKGVHDEDSGFGHLIISARFDSNVIAHLEYSSINTEKELLEMEMSVLDSIIEYTSDRKSLSFLSPAEKEYMPLDVQSILDHPLHVNSQIHTKISGLVSQIPLVGKGEN
jgi:hypothetical protein